MNVTSSVARVSSSSSVYSAVSLGENCEEYDFKAAKATAESKVSDSASKASASSPLPSLPKSINAFTTFVASPNSPTSSSYADEPIPNKCQPSPNTPSFAQSVAHVPTVVTDTK